MTAFFVTMPQALNREGQLRKQKDTRNPESKPNAGRARHTHRAHGWVQSPKQLNRWCDCVL
jgi:hypothetical protein